MRTRIIRPSFIDDDSIEVVKIRSIENKREDLSLFESEYEMAASKRD